MELTLSVRSYCGQPPDLPNARTFTDFPIILGRSASCDYVLRDANMYISSNHATIRLKESRLILTDTSANGTYLNASGDPLGKGNSIEINSTDLLYIGDYCVLVEFSSDQLPVIDDTFDGINDALAKPTAPSSPQATPYHDDDWLPDSDSSATEDILDLGDLKRQNSVVDANCDFEDQPIQSRKHPAVTGRIADDDDWPDLDEHELPDLPGNRAQQPSDNSISSQSDDLLDWLPDTGEAVTVPGLQPTDSHGPQNSPNHSPADTHNVQAIAYPSPGDYLDLSDFLVAVEVEPHLLPPNDRSRLLFRAGRILNAMTDGIIRLLQARRVMKDAMQDDVTQLGSTNNNPLKFSHNASDALGKMLVSSAPGYQSPEQAIRESISDINLHQIAMLEAMKEAVRTTLLKFDPDSLADKLERDRPIAANIPLKREAALWKLFHTHYNEIRDEAVDDFGELFQRELCKAYQAHVAEARKKPDF